ncbi:hypothetical protein NSQ38_22745 [Paenibacillus sp. FSL R7-0313]
MNKKKRAALWQPLFKHTTTAIRPAIYDTTGIFPVTNNVDVA